MKPSRQFIRFCIAGVVGLAVDLVVLHALAPLSNWYLARAFSFWAAVTTTWFLNRNFTFKTNPIADSLEPKIWQLLREYRHYFAAMLTGGSLNYLTYAITLKYLLVPYAATVGVIAGSVVGLMLNFSLSRWFIFNKK